MPSLSEMLLAQVSSAVAQELAEIPDLDATLVALARMGREALPEVTVPTQAWAHYVARHVREGEVARQLADLHAADVHLTLGCLAGDPVAHRELDVRLRRVCGQALAGMRLREISVDEVLQAARVKLLTGDGREAKLASYAGRGPLEGWLRVMLARTALSMLRVRDPMAPGSGDDEEALVGLAGDDDPRLASIRARCAPVLNGAVERAARELPAADRMLLRLHLVDGLTIDDLAVAYGIHRATAARRLARARGDLMEKARAHAIEALGLSGEEELASLAGLLVSEIDVTIRRILGDRDSEARR